MSKILVATYDPLDKEALFSYEVQEFIAIDAIDDIEELSSGFEYDALDYYYILSTACKEYHDCKDEERKARVNGAMIPDEIMFVSKEEVIVNAEDEEFGEEEWEEIFIDAVNHFFEHLYSVEAEV